MKQKILNRQILLGGLALILAIIAYFFFSTEATNNINVNEAIIKANDYLYAQMLPDGKFVYRKDMDPKRKLKEKYNILRHMGALYSLYMMEEYKPGSLQEDKIRKSIKYIKDNTFKKYTEDKMGIWSQESFSGRKGQIAQTKLGAAGLSLIALCPMLEKFMDVISLDELKQIGNTILHMQKEDGSFYSIMYQDGKFNKEWVSLYYPGEAIFGLVELYKVSQDIRYLNAALKGILYLEESRRELNIPQMLPDHWALIASSKLLALPNIKEEDRQRINSHANKIIKLMLSEQIHYSKFKSLVGGFSSKGNTTPTATRVEGLNAMYPYITDVNLQRQTKESIKKAINFLIKNQLDAPPFTGAWRRSVFRYDVEGYRKIKGKDNIYRKQQAHNKRVNEVRIDYIQHALSALIGYEQMIK